MQKNNHEDYKWIYQFQDTIIHSPHIFYQCKLDDGLPIEFISDNITQFGYQPSELINNASLFASFIHEEDLENINQEIKNNLKQNTESFKQQYRIYDKQSNIHWIEDWRYIHHKENNQVAFITGILTDITDKKNAKHELERLSMLDTMTNIFNRKRLYQSLEAEIDRARRYREVFSLIIFDIDHLKQINQSLGHDHGDQVIISVVAIVNDIIRMSDVFARWGGEEFMILTPQTKLRGATQLAERIRKEIDKKKFPNVGHVTASFGVARLRRGENQEDILKRVDKALTLAKENGRNIVVNLGEDVEL